MPYQQTSAPDVDQIKRSVSELLGLELRHVALSFESGGYSGGVHRLTAHDASGASYSLLLKRNPANTSYRFFLDVLDPYTLNSPHMFGRIDGGDAPYLVMEYIPHEPPDWGDLGKYQRAIDWLAYKDGVAEQHLEEISQLDYVHPFELGELDERVAVLRSAVAERLDPLLTPRLLATVENHRHRFAEAAVRVVGGPKTVVHNDFQMLNILFASGAKRGRLYVVDWTGPAIGSVCIDLATLIHVAPAELRSRLIQRYLAARPVPDFTAQFAAAQMHVHLSILSWMIDAIRSGQQHAVARTKMRELAAELEHFFAV